MQKRIAADIFDVGESRVWLDPEKSGEISTAITRDDVRRLIDTGAIKKKPKTSISKGRARKTQQQKKKGRRSGPGSRKGPKGGRKSEKKEWISKVRALRKKLKELRADGKIDSSLYRELYRKVKGGAFRSKSHLETHLKDKGVLEEE